MLSAEFTLYASMCAKCEVFTVRPSIVYLGYLYGPCTCRPETPTVLSPTPRFPQQQRWGGVDKRKKRPRNSSRDEASMDGMEDDSDQPAEAEAKVNSRGPFSILVRPNIRLPMRTPSCRVLVSLEVPCFCTVIVILILTIRVLVMQLLTNSTRIVLLPLQSNDAIV